MAGTQLSVGDVDQEQRFGALRADPQLLRAIALLIGDRLLILRVVPEIAGAAATRKNTAAAAASPVSRRGAALAGELVAPPRASLARMNSRSASASSAPRPRSHSSATIKGASRKRNPSSRARPCHSLRASASRWRQTRNSRSVSIQSRRRCHRESAPRHHLGRGLAACLVVLGDHQPGIGQAGDRRPVPSRISARLAIRRVSSVPGPGARAAGGRLAPLRSAGLSAR